VVDQKTESPVTGTRRRAKPSAAVKASSDPGTSDMAAVPTPVYGEKQMTQTTTTPAEVFANGARLVGDAMLPGISQVVNGDIKNGALHAAVAVGATVLGGGLVVPIVWAASAMNSYSRSVTGRNVIDHFKAQA